MKLPVLGNVRLPFGGSSYDVAGKAILITGAGSGIGFALAKRLHEQGAMVALVDVNEKSLADAKNVLKSGVVMYVGDVTDREGMAEVVGKAIAHFGRLDVVIANAGVTPPPATMRTMDLAAYDKVVSINQTGILNTVQPALESIIEHKGHVVVVASCAAFSPGVGGMAYMSSKAAAEQIGRALKIELAPHGASAGVAYFGIVDTALAHATLDDDPMGKDLDNMLGWPLNHRISADDAAKSVTDGIGRRAATTIAPARWLPYSLLRGVINTGVDLMLVNDKRVHRMVRDLEARINDAKADTE